MPLHPRRKPDAAQELQQQKDAINFAWQVHNAQEAWTGKVDTKASILLALEGGSLFAVLAANAERGALRALTGLAVAFETAGVLLLLVALLCSAGAVFPLLGRVRQHKLTYRAHFIYFGHVRHWQPPELAEALRRSGEDSEFDMLARQLIAMSKRNWAKHRLVQLSLLSSLLGVLFIGVSLAI